MDLTGATVTFSMENAAGTNKITNATARITDAPGGVVRYEWASADLDTVGSYTGQFKIVFVDGGIEFTDKFELEVEDSV